MIVFDDHALSDPYMCESRLFINLKPLPQTFPGISSKPVSQLYPGKKNFPSDVFHFYLIFLIVSYLFLFLLVFKEHKMSTFLFADNEVLVFLRRGSAVMVEVAPKFSNIDISSKDAQKVEQTFSFLHSIQKSSSPAPSHTQQNNIRDT